MKTLASLSLAEQLARLRCACQGALLVSLEKHSRCFDNQKKVCPGSQSRLLMHRSYNSLAMFRTGNVLNLPGSAPCIARKTLAMLVSLEKHRRSSSQRSLLDYSTNVLFHKGFMEKFRKFSEILRFLIWVKEVNYHKIDLFTTQIIVRGGAWE